MDLTSWTPLTSWMVALVSVYLLVKLLLVVTRNTAYTKMVNKITGPPTLPLLGNTWDVWVDREDIIMNLIKLLRGYEKVGLCRIWVGPEAYVFATRAPAMEAILTSTKHITKSADYAYFHSWLGMGLLTSTGEKWQKHRKMLTPSFHFRILDDFVSVFDEQSEILVEILKEKAKSGEKFDLYPYVTRCALDIICESTMGKNVQAQRIVNSEYVNAVSGMGAIILLRIFRPWLKPAFLFNLTSHRRDEKRYLRTLHSFSRKVIKERKQILEEKKAQKSASVQSEEAVLGSKKRLAFLDLLLEASSEGGKGLTDEEIREEVDTFMFEGHDTTAAGISWTLYLLGRHPEIQRKVQEELEQVLGRESERAITSGDLVQLKYLEAVIKESLRLYPSVPFFGRKLKEQALIDGYTIPAGTTVFIGAIIAHHDPETFPDPEKFDPDRFLSDAAVGRHPFAYVPFSAGPRNCIGQKFALAEEKVVLAKFLHHFDVISHDAPADIKYVAEPILRPVHGINVSVKERCFS